MLAVFVDLAGAIALLLWGIRLVRTGMTRAVGAGLREVVKAGTRNRFVAFASGLGATVALQSSTATSLMAATFASRGLLNITMALAIMLGADVGTALVAQALSMDVRWLSPGLIALGGALYWKGDGTRWRDIGTSVLGVGMMMLALKLLRVATAPIGTSDITIEILAVFGQVPLLSLAAAAGIAALAHSSLATIMLLASLATAGVIDPTAALAMVLGVNVGSSVPPLVAASALGQEGKRVPVGNALMRMSGALFALPFVGVLAGMTALVPELAADMGQVVVAFHLAFNLAVAALYLPLVSMVARLVERLVPNNPAEEDASRPKHLDPSALDTPAVAIACAARETIRVCDIVEEMLAHSMDAFRGGDERQLQLIANGDNVVDDLHREIKLYLARLGHEELDDADARRSADVMAFIINLEHIGDVIDRSLRELALKQRRDGLHLSAEDMREMDAMHARTAENLRMAVGIFMSGDGKMARLLVEGKEQVRLMEREAKQRHVDRLRRGLVDGLEASALLLDVLRDLKRINAHLASIAYPILDRAGELRESRLRKPRDAADAALLRAAPARIEPEDGMAL